MKIAKLHRLCNKKMEVQGKAMVVYRGTGPGSWNVLAEDDINNTMVIMAGARDTPC